MPFTTTDAITHLQRIGYSTKLASNVILVREALHRGITVTKSERLNYLELTHDGKTHRWRAGRNSLNSTLATQVAQYKNVTAALLRAQGLNGAENILVAPTEVDRAWEWARCFSAITIKPNDGKQGNDVHVGITEKHDFYSIFRTLASKRETDILVEKTYRGVQHRCFAIRGKLRATALMRPPGIIGDGASTIEKLVEEKNQGRTAHPSHKPILLSVSEIEYLNSRGLEKSSIPSSGEYIYLSAISNLQHGGDAIDVTESLSPSQVAVVNEAVKAIPGLAIAGVDVMFDVKGESNDFVVLEVNANPQISIHHHPWEGAPQDIASSVIDAFFPSTIRN